MIYITYNRKYDYPLVENVYESSLDIVKLYKKFLLKKADSLQILINNYWYNIMNFEIHKDIFDLEEYKKVSKEWNKFLEKNDMDFFIQKKLKISPLKFKNLIR